MRVLRKPVAVSFRKGRRAEEPLRWIRFVLGRLRRYRSKPEDLPAGGWCSAASRIGQDGIA